MMDKNTVGGQGYLVVDGRDVKGSVAITVGRVRVDPDRVPQQHLHLDVIADVTRSATRAPRTCQPSAHEIAAVRRT